MIGSGVIGGLAERAKRPASLLLAAALLVNPATAADQGRAVVELFTSQGCSSCPPANANLAVLGRRPDVIALSFGVTYWDRLGWKDTFARRDFTARQEAYETPLGESGPFTPQIVVGGRASLVGDQIAAIEDLISRDHANVPATQITLSPGAVGLGSGAVSVGAGQAPSGGADIWLVRYDPARVDVPVRAGENGGRTLPHTHVVRDLTLIGRWSGTPQTLPIASAASRLHTAVLVQVTGGGPILAAASD